jgi:DNA-binding CsgD family transcriptional regulator
MPYTPIGRAGELSSIEVFIERASTGSVGLLVRGEPGIGKTLLLEAAVERCSRGNVRVLVCRCSEAEAGFSFGGLSDLLAPVFDEASPALPAPRRHAVEVALLRREPGALPVNPRAIGLGVLDVLTYLAERRPVVVAVDDLQWLDSATWTVLQIALRRLAAEQIGFIATVRETVDLGLVLALERLFAEGRLVRVSLGPLSLGAIHRLLSDRLGLELTRPELRRVVGASAGNPFFALELGRELVRTGARPRPHQPLPVPTSLGALLAQRLDRLPPETRRVLVAAAALGRPSIEVLEAMETAPHEALEALEIAAREGVVELEGSQVRFSHPLLAAACYQGEPLSRRRQLHRVLAELVEDDEERVRHQALAASRADAKLAADVEAAAITATTRGSGAAAQLLELAADLTPAGDGSESRRRQMAAALFYDHAGDSEHAVALLKRLLHDSPVAGERAEVLLLLASSEADGLSAALERCDEAFVAADGDEQHEARVLATRASLRVHVNVAGALADGRAAVEKAERLSHSRSSAPERQVDRYAPPVLLTAAMARLAYVETCAQSITPGLLERGVALEARLKAPRHVTYWDSPSTMLACRLICRDELDQARALLEEKLAQLTSDDGRSAAHTHLSWLEWLTGGWLRAREHATEAVELAEDTPRSLGHARALHAAALVDAHLGRDDARDNAERALASAQATSSELLTIESLAVLGNLEFALGNLPTAVDYLGELPQRLVSLGWSDPSSPLWTDAIETLARVGELEAASTCLMFYEDRARRGSRRAQACAARCRGLIAAAEGESDRALGALERSLRETPASYPFERARTLLALGEIHRHVRRRALARAALEASLAIFEELGAALWVEKARAELRRISGRRPGAGELTETEHRVAELASEGRSNKEIASTLFMSVHTVEAHLTRIYRKLGVSSRAALAHHISAAPRHHAKL